MRRVIPVGKLQVEINPELVAITSKHKKLDVFAIWLVFRTIDKHKQGTGKFLLSTCIDLIHEITKCNKNYCYEIFKKGINSFWNNPTGTKGNKIVYLFGINKVVELFSFELTKTKPFYIKMEDLFRHDSAADLKSFLTNFVIGRFGQTKPITLDSLSDNLGVSESTLKRRIRTSDILTKRKNFCFLNKDFASIADAYDYLRTFKNSTDTILSSYRIVSVNKKYQLVQQMGNSYSCDDFSRGRISKRPKLFRIIDSENKETFKKKKFYVSKTKNAREKDSIYVKTKNDHNDYYSWKMINPLIDDHTYDNIYSSRQKWLSYKKRPKTIKEC